MGLVRECRLRRFLWLEGLSLAGLEVGAGVVFGVPVRSDGAGFLEIGDNNSFGFLRGPRIGDGGILLQPRAAQSEIRIGHNNTFSNNVAIVANESVCIGDWCLMGDQVAVFDSDFHEVDAGARHKGIGRSKAVVIEDNVWLGSRVLVLKGVTIGENSVIAAMSVVTRSVPANTVAAGNPARVLRGLGG